jgi:antagonist of KipI
VGNAENCAGLEITQTGPELEFSADVLVAAVGPRLEQLEPGRPQVVRGREPWSPGRLLRGCRGWLAIAGGLEVPEILGGRGTDLRAGWGGWQGRALRPGDTIPLGAALRRTTDVHWRMDDRWLPGTEAAQPQLRVLPGAQAAEFGPNWPQMSFEVSPQSDRMGIRLHGAPLLRNTTAELFSTAVAPGTVQVPPDGRPIILGVDAQTIGGYPQLAHVITVDLPKVAQLRPGDRVYFQPVTLAEARRHLLEREKRLQILRRGLEEKFW